MTAFLVALAAAGALTALWQWMARREDRTQAQQERTRLLAEITRAELTAKARLIDRGWAPPRDHPGYANLARELACGPPAMHPEDEEEHATADVPPLSVESVIAELVGDATYPDPDESRGSRA